MMREVLPFVAVFALASSVSGQGLPEGDPHDHARAGFPQFLSKWAHPSNNPRYIGYYAGGGAVSRRKGELPGPEEGTWGWDYQGGLFKRRVNLLWWHGTRYQGGSGAYRTDGPHLPHTRTDVSNGSHP